MIGDLGDLVVPEDEPVLDQVEASCLEMIEESVDDLVAGVTGGKRKRKSYRGDDYDDGYAQGCKDAARRVLIEIGRPSLGVTTTKRMLDHPRPPERPTKLVVPPGESTTLEWEDE